MMLESKTSVLKEDYSILSNETLKIIKQRRSIRSYESEQVKDEELQAILEAAQYAPHAGEEAWYFTVVQNEDLLKRLNYAAKEAACGMKMKHLRNLGKDKNFNCLYNAPTLIIVSGNDKSPIPLNADCAAATQNMLLAAESIGLGSCWIYFVLLAFYSQQGPQFRKELKIPEGYKPYNAAVFGYKKETVSIVPERKPNLITFIR